MRIWSRMWSAETVSRACEQQAGAYIGWENRDALGLCLCKLALGIVRDAVRAFVNRFCFAGLWWTRVS